MDKVQLSSRKVSFLGITPCPIFLVLFLFCYSPCLVYTSRAHSHTNINSPPFGDAFLFDDEFSSNGNIGRSNNNNNNGVSLCLPNYEISEGSIIRTKDSVDLGARFINESDLGVNNGREECLRLCCRTPYCNVAVFQEKSSGSCYMFDCGPPEDFRCKFTSQIQYMSGILRRKEIIQVSSSNQQNNVLSHSSSNFANSNSNGNNQHETELSQLRSRGEELELKGSKNNNNAPITKHNANGGLVAPTTSSSTAPLLGPLDGVSSRGCSRWQFECKSSGECIAIYNACDGIPNCEDGSDESPELHCPSVLGQGAPPVSHLHPPSQQQSVSVNEINQNRGQSKNGDMLGFGKGNSNDHIFNHKDGGVMNQNYGGQLQQQQQQQNHLNPFLKQQGYDYPMNGEQIPSSGVYGGTNSQISGNPYGGNGGLGVEGYSGQGSYPYNSGYQNQPLNLPQFGSQSNMNTNNNNFGVPPILQQQQTYYGSSKTNKGQLQQQTPQQNPLFNPPLIQNTNSMASSSNSMGVKAGGEMESGNLQRLSPQQNQPAAVAETTTVPKLDSQSKSVTSSSSMDKSTKSEKTSLTPIKGRSGDDDSAAETKMENEILKSLKNQQYNEAALAAVHLDSEDVSPHNAGPGALFLFIIGLGMTIVMVVIVGCRLRRLGIGARRRRKNRLDPDYLVDGMYL